MGTIQPITGPQPRQWSDQEMEEWLAAHAGQATHVIAVQAVLTVAVLIPPWESPRRVTGRAAVGWGTEIRQAVLDDVERGVDVVAVHIEQNMAHCTQVTAPVPQENHPTTAAS